MNAEPSRRPEGTTYNLVFVCTGNTCRSPMAATIARHLVAERGWSHVEIRSAGIAAMRGEPASEHAATAAAEHGLDLSAHEAQPVTPELLDWADMILAMGTSHLRAIETIGAGDRASLVTAFIDGPGANEAVNDPFGGTLDEYRITWTQLEAAVAALLDRLEPILAP